MRTLFLASGLLSLIATACTGGPEAERNPPVLKVTSPQRSLQQAGGGQIKVTGTVAPNLDGDAIDKVLVNNVAASVDPAGNFQATIDIPAGASLITTIARDVRGTEARDTRAVQVGELRTAGDRIERAIAASLSTQAFAKISAAAGPLVKNMNVGQMLAPMQPMIRVGDPADLNQEDCAFARGYIDDVKFSDFKVSLVPKQGGIAFSAEVDGLDVPGHARFSVPLPCIKGTQSFRVAASKIVVSGTLLVTPNGMAGFNTNLVDQNVTIQGLDISASGIPGEIIDLLDLGSRIQGVVAKAAELAMKPMMNSALGALAGPKQLDVLGKTVTVEVAPADISFDPVGGLVVLDTKFAIGGAENAKFIYTDNGVPALDAGDGFQLGLADDLANELMAEATALGILAFEMPASGGTFDNAKIAMTLPPMISADPADGSMKVVLGDMTSTYTNHGTPVAKTAINAMIDLRIVPSETGYGIALQLGKPVIRFNVLDDIANDTRMSNEDLEHASEAALEAQIASLSKLLVNIPLPAVAGLQMRNLSVGSDDGYVIVQGTFE